MSEIIRIFCFIAFIANSPEIFSASGQAETVNHLESNVALFGDWTDFINARIF